jgi:hypothetical protein
MSPPPPDQRCRALTPTGSQCSLCAQKGSTHCYVHTNSQDVVDIAAPPSNGWAREQAERREVEISKAESDRRDREAALDASTITAGMNAWGRLRREGARLTDWRLIGAALLVGRRLSMQAVNTRKPRGVKYVIHNSQWLDANGFAEITRSSRQAAMLLAENWIAFSTWLKTQSPERRTRLNHSVAAWNAYRNHGRPPRPSNWRLRHETTTQAFARAIKAAKAEAPELDDDIIRRVVMAVARELGVSVPRPVIVKEAHQTEPIPLAAEPA